MFRELLKAGLFLNSINSVNRACSDSMGLSYTGMSRTPQTILTKVARSTSCSTARITHEWPTEEMIRNVQHLPANNAWHKLHSRPCQLRQCVAGAVCNIVAVSNSHGPFQLQSEWRQPSVSMQDARCNVKAQLCWCMETKSMHRHEAQAEWGIPEWHLAALHSGVVVPHWGATAASKSQCLALGCVSALCYLAWTAAP